MAKISDDDFEDLHTPGPGHEDDPVVVGSPPIPITDLLPVGKPGADTETAKQTNSAGVMGLLGMIFGVLVTLAPDLINLGRAAMDLLPVESTGYRVSGAVIAGLALILKLGATRGYQTTTKEREISRNESVVRGLEAQTKTAEAKAVVEIAKNDAVAAKAAAALLAAAKVEAAKELKRP